ncbi:phosphatase PAP2 family protein [Ureibacillus acetophenoni]|uniref:Undecaprenyl-diphosphatase n=1 Tax=Ureibacillus acetophenoni TaxID=614649 RepID=A0A285UJQ8_9BACL|nr:phosphatase PAP2 family protein [Ureibacillus acetophenoni]SOC42003.1 undecaprenyl-diphosphatase [Ureibacillus acetophenoni]
MKRWAYILSIFTLILFFVLTFTYEHPTVVGFDESINELIYGNKFISFFHLFGETKFIVTISIVLILSLWFRQRNYRGMLLVVLVVGAGNGINKLLKSIFERPRPELVDQLTSFSFPSGHAMIGLLYIFLIAYILTDLFASKRATITLWSIATILAVLVGLSRVTDNHHYFSDVVAGWSIGFTWFMICIYWYETRKRKINTLKKSA